MNGENTITGTLCYKSIDDYELIFKNNFQKFKNFNFKEKNKVITI